MQLLVGKSSHLARLTLPNQRSLIFSCRVNVAIQAVVGEIQLSAYVPFGPGMLPLEHLVPFPEPVQLLGYTSPESVRMLDRFSIDSLIIFAGLNVRSAPEFFWRCKFTLLLEHGVDASYWHS